MERAAFNFTSCNVKMKTKRSFETSITIHPASRRHIPKDRILHHTVRVTLLTAAYNSTPQHTATHSSTPLHTTAHSSPPQHTAAPHCTPQHTAVHHSTQQHPNTHHSTLQHGSCHTTHHVTVPHEHITAHTARTHQQYNSMQHSPS